MRVPSGKTDQSIYFVAYDSSDHTTRKTGLSSFTAYRSRNGGAATVYTTPTIVELSSSNMPGTYAFLIDEDTTVASGSDSEEYCVHITATGMDSVTRTIELYRRDVTAGNQLLVDSNGRVDVIKLAGTTQTARDVGASVLLSAGTGTGQLDFTSGVVKANLAQILGTALTETAGQIAVAFKQFFNIASPTSTMNAITTVTTATNLTNAPTSGDFTATMKTSLNAATPASVAGSVGSVTGNVGGNVVGSVASVTGNVGGNVVGSVASVTAGVTVTTNNDKTGYALSSAGVQAIWDVLTSALTTASSVGKLLVDNINATISSRLASSGYTAPDNTSITAIKAKTDNLPATPAATGDAMTLTSAYDAAKTAATQTSVDDLPTNAELATALAGADDATLAAIAALPTIITVNAIKTQTDKLSFTKANELDANIHSVNDVSVMGIGTSGSPWGPA